MTSSETLHTVHRMLSEWFEQYYSDIEAFGDDLSTIIEFDPSSTGNITEAARRKIRDRSVLFLDEHELPDGAGVVFSRSATGSTEGSLEWWVRDPDQRVARYSFGVNPTGDRFYDYERLEWFETAFLEQHRAIAGPYIDYLGVEEYIVTCTIPLRVNGKVVGVVGTDNRMADVERVLLPMLRQLPGDAAILNPHRNVLVGNSGRFMSGDRIPEVPDGFAVTPLDVAGIDLALLHAD